MTWMCKCEASNAYNFDSSGECQYCGTKHPGLAQPSDLGQQQAQMDATVAGIKRAQAQSMWGVANMSAVAQTLRQKHDDGPPLVQAQAQEITRLRALVDAPWAQLEMVEQNANLRCRVAELEAESAKRLQRLHEMDAQLLAPGVYLGDLRRKREECERLEAGLSAQTVLAEQRSEALHLTERALTEARLEVVRLRRELRGRK